jgi:hypothetical protein
VQVGDHSIRVQKSPTDKNYHDLNILGQDAMKELELQHYNIYGNGTGTIWFTKPEHRGYHVMIDPRIHGRIFLVRHLDGHPLHIDDSDLDLKMLEITRM